MSRVAKQCSSCCQPPDLRASASMALFSLASPSPVRFASPLHPPAVDLCSLQRWVCAWWQAPAPAPPVCRCDCGHHQDHPGPARRWQPQHSGRVGAGHRRQPPAAAVEDDERGGLVSAAPLHGLNPGRDAVTGRAGCRTLCAPVGAGAARVGGQGAVHTRSVPISPSRSSAPLARFSAPNRYEKLCSS